MATAVPSFAEICECSGNLICSIDTDKIPKMVWQLSAMAKKVMAIILPSPAVTTDMAGSASGIFLVKLPENTGFQPTQKRIFDNNDVRTHTQKRKKRQKERKKKNLR